MNRALAWGLALSLAASPAAAARQSTPDRGIQLIAAGNAKEAVAWYRSQTEQYPNSSAAYTGLGVALERTGQPRDAREAYERALRLDATDVRAMNNLANLLIDGDLDLPRAKRLLKRALELKPDLAIAWDNMGWAFYKEKNFGQAVAHLKRALSIDPRQASANYHLGFCYLQSNDYAKAQPYLARATKLDPSNARVWMALGLAQQKLDRKEEAKTSYQEALGRVDRKSSVGRELVRLINGLGQPFGAGDNLLGSPDSVFAKYTPPPADLPAPFESSGMYNLPGTAGGAHQTPVADIPRGAAAVPALPGTMAAPATMLAAHASSGEMTAPPPVGLPPAVLAARNRQESAVNPAPAPAASGLVEPRAGSIILSHRSTGSDSPDPGAARNLEPSPNEGPTGPATVFTRPRPAQAVTYSAPERTVERSETAVKQDLLETHLKMATMYEEHGLYQDAVSEGQTVVNLAPFSREATQARELVARLSKREEAEPEQRIYGLIKLGEKFYAEHQLEPAVLQFEKVLVLNPRHPIAFKDLAFLNLRANRLEVAYDQAKKALELEPDYQEALLIKGHIEARQRQFRASYDTFKKLGELAREGTAMRQYAVGLTSKMRRFVELE